MKDPRSLHVEVFIDYAQFNHYGAEAGEITVASLLSALNPQSEKLQEIFLRVNYYGKTLDCYVAGKAFREFSALKRLDIPIEVLMQFDDGHSALTSRHLYMRFSQAVCKSLCSNQNPVYGRRR